MLRKLDSLQDIALVQSERKLTGIRMTELLPRELDTLPAFHACVVGQALQVMQLLGVRFGETWSAVMLPMLARQKPSEKAIPRSRWRSRK